MLIIYSLRNNQVEWHCRA